MSIIFRCDKCNTDFPQMFNHLKQVMISSYDPDREWISMKEYHLCIKCTDLLRDFIATNPKLPREGKL